MAKLARLERHLSAGDTGLILFDALNGYLHPNNPAKVQFLAERNIIPNLQRLLQGARRVGMTTFYPSGAHAPDGSGISSPMNEAESRWTSPSASRMGKPTKAVMGRPRGVAGS